MMDSVTSEPTLTVPERLTPMMAQYLELKAAFPDYLLFYRMGDFFELFFDDAEIASRALGIALTKRGKHLGVDIPMCGVPLNTAEQYLQKLIKLEHRVAVCDQMEDPREAKKRGAKSVVKRAVTRLVTPGTITEDSLLESRRHNFLGCLVALRGLQEIAFAWADISSGDITVLTSDLKRLGADLARIAPREIIVSDGLMADEAVRAFLEGLENTAITALSDVRFESVSAEKRLKEHYKVAAFEGFGSFSRVEIAALGSLIEYIILTQVGHVPFLRSPARETSSDGLLIDAASRSNLELTRRLNGERQGSLLSVIDLTITAAGARLLASRLASPLAQAAAIEARLDEVSFFEAAAPLRQTVREDLTHLPDLERALGRLVLGRGGPRDLAAIRDGLKYAEAVGARILPGGELSVLPDNIAAAKKILSDIPFQLISQLEKGLGEDLPLLARDGGFIAPGFISELDQARALRDDTKQVIAQLQTHYAEATGIKNLKIRYNNMIGYFIEVAAQHAATLRQENFASEFHHRQTVANAVRFSTATLLELEQKIASAAERSLNIELESFTQFSASVAAEKEKISLIALSLATIDVASSLAELVVRNRYVRPVVDHTRAFKIVSGRHPVVEDVLKKQGESRFIPNNCNLSDDDHRLWLLTGPNMAGKSTFLRQNALIAILAQMGSFVPAAQAHIGIVDRLFSRVGAADDLARGRSTFMVEMVETAAILNQATAHSLVILDEIGRGTATFDGLSIAWATVEHLHDVNQCRALFATHYHELTVLAKRLDGLSNATVKVREWQNDVIFLHEVVPGVADGSYGIQVARLAGLPALVTDRASVILEQLEQNERASQRATLIDDLPLFSAVRDMKAVPPEQDDEVRQQLKLIKPDELSPRQAQDALYHLVSLLQASS